MERGYLLGQPDTPELVAVEEGQSVSGGYSVRKPFVVGMKPERGDRLLVVSDGDIGAQETLPLGQDRCGVHIEEEYRRLYDHLPDLLQGGVHLYVCHDTRDCPVPLHML